MPDRPMRNRFPGYDVLAKSATPSWNDKTREVVAARLAVPREPRFFTEHEFRTVDALAARIVPQPAHRDPIPVAALVDHKLQSGRSDGYRVAGMPREGEAWRMGLKAIDEEARKAHECDFVSLKTIDQDRLLMLMERGELRDPAWGKMGSKTFFKKRMAHDIVFAYYSHPTAWSEIGWGGPASPRGYVRMDFDERDPWEAAEVRHGDVTAALRANRRVG